jgi:murein DD-endopeptidase MepM/ murein hydrolase activator NlpD
MILPVKYDLGGYRQFGKIYEDNLYHLGHDFKVDIGIEVMAIAKGQILDIREANGFGGWNPQRRGFYIWIQHNNICALYGHVKSFNIKIGDLIKEGQVIGNVHDYIRDNFHLPHLHFGVWQGLNQPNKNLGYDKDLKQWIDPKKFIRENIL